MVTKIPVVVVPHQEVVIPILLYVLLCVHFIEPLYFSVVVAIRSKIPVHSISKLPLNLAFLGIHLWAMSYGTPFPVCHYVYQSYR